MVDILIMSRDDCEYCDQAKQLLTAIGVSYREQEQSEGRVPQIFINDRHIGGFQELEDVVYDEERWQEAISK